MATDELPEPIQNAPAINLDNDGRIVSFACYQGDCHKVLSFRDHSSIAEIMNAINHHVSNECPLPLHIDPTPRQILDTPMRGRANDAGANTIREYLSTLLIQLWRNSDSFSGKHPFGYSGWKHDLWEALGRAGYIRYINNFQHNDIDKERGNYLIALAIKALGNKE